MEKKKFGKTQNLVELISMSIIDMLRPKTALTRDPKRAGEKLFPPVFYNIGDKLDHHLSFNIKTKWVFIFIFIYFKLIIILTN